jgi:hypothetical protein
VLKIKKEFRDSPVRLSLVTTKYVLGRPLRNVGIGAGRAEVLGLIRVRV